MKRLAEILGLSTQFEDVDLSKYNPPLNNLLAPMRHKYDEIVKEIELGFNSFRRIVIYLGGKILDNTEAAAKALLVEDMPEQKLEEGRTRRLTQSENVERDFRMKMENLHDGLQKIQAEFCSQLRLEIYNPMILFCRDCHNKLQVIQDVISRKLVVLRKMQRSMMKRKRKALESWNKLCDLQRQYEENKDVLVDEKLAKLQKKISVAIQKAEEEFTNVMDEVEELNKMEREFWETDLQVALDQVEGMNTVRFRFLRMYLTKYTSLVEWRCTEEQNLLNATRTRDVFTESDAIKQFAALLKSEYGDWSLPPKHSDFPLPCAADEIAMKKFPDNVEQVLLTTIPPYRNVFEQDVLSLARNWGQTSSKGKLKSSVSPISEGEEVDIKDEIKAMKVDWSRPTFSNDIQRDTLDSITPPSTVKLSIPQKRPSLSNMNLYRNPETGASKTPEDVYKPLRSRRLPKIPNQEHSLVKKQSSRPEGLEVNTLRVDRDSLSVVPDLPENSEIFYEDETYGESSVIGLGTERDDTMYILSNVPTLPDGFFPGRENTSVSEPCPNGSNPVAEAKIGKALQFQKGKQPKKEVSVRGKKKLLHYSPAKKKSEKSSISEVREGSNSKATGQVLRKSILKREGGVKKMAESYATKTPLKNSNIEPTADYLENKSKS